MINKLQSEVFRNSDDELEKVLKTVTDALNLFASIKKKYDLDNQIFFVTKYLPKEIMPKSRLKNKYL